MNIYIAHNYAAKQMLLETVVPLLESNGHFVTSRWIKNTEIGIAQDDAVKDLMDIGYANTLIFFANQYGINPGRGKYIELGYALRDGKRCIVVGNEEDKKGCIFYNLPTIRFVSTIVEALKYI